jgi:hypothetical protein
VKGGRAGREEAALAVAGAAARAARVRRDRWRIRLSKQEIKAWDAWARDELLLSAALGELLAGGFPADSPRWREEPVPGITMASLGAAYGLLPDGAWLTGGDSLPL